MNKIAIIEDDIDICNIIAKFLENNKYIIHYALNDAEGIELCKSLVPDLIILDIMLPKLNGNDVLQRLRKFTNAPVIVVSAKTMVQTKIDLLKLGADDYMTKPFNLEEFLLRVNVLVKRSLSQEEKKEINDIFKFNDNEVNFLTYEIIGKDKTKIRLTKKEIALLKLLIERKNEVVSREQILETVWGYDIYPSTRTVDNFILAFRKYFENDPKDPQYFFSVRGVGYKFVCE